MSTARDSTSVNPYESPRTDASLPPVPPQPIWDEIEIEYDLTLEDYVAFNVHHLLHSRAQRRTYLQVSVRALVLLELVNLVVLVIRAFGRPLTGFDFLLHGVIGLALLIGFGIRMFRDRHRLPRAFARNYERAVRNLLADGDYSNVLGPRRFRVTREFMENEGLRWQSRWQLEAIQRIEVTPQYGFVYTAPSQAIILPVRVFTSPDHFATFITNLEGHTGKVAERMKS